PPGFIACDSVHQNLADYCADDGTIQSVDCGAQCLGGGSCGLCSPNSPSCENGAVTACDAQGRPAGTTTCFTLGAQTGMCAGSSCAACTGTSVCGDGAHYGTVRESEYACAN